MWAAFTGPSKIINFFRSRDRYRPTFMAFTQTNITNVKRPVQYGTELLLSWTSSAVAGTVFQVYVDQQLVWSGTGRSCSIPLPGAVARIDIGAIGLDEDQANFASSLPGAPRERLN